MNKQEKNTSENDKKIEESPKSNEKIQRPKNYDELDFCSKCRGRGGLTYPCDRCGKRVEC
jgi:hypothetical protein